MSWQSLIAIINESRDLADQAAAKTPVECPNDYTTLVSAPDGGLFCPWDGWRYPDDA